MNSNMQLVVLLKQHVETHINDSDFNVSKLCLFICISRASMYRKIMRLYHCGPKEYIEDIRLEIAKKKIDTEDCRLKNIAFDVGFSNQKYFTKKFKEKYMMTPSEYKKQIIVS